MPDPLAFTTRREFLAGSLGLVSAASTLPVFLGHTARALGQTAPAGTPDDSQRILVVVQLAGGNDGLNTVVPVDQGAYYALRPRLAVQKRDALALTSDYALHPAATGLKSLYDSGRLAVVQGVGYPNPNRSHFTSTDIWMTGDPSERTHTGWLGRYFDATCQGTDCTRGPLDSIALTGEAPLALQGQSFTPLAFQNANSLAWNAPKGDKQAEETFRILNNHAPTVASEPEAEFSAEDHAAFIQRAALHAQIGADEIRAALGRGQTRMRANGALSQSLDLVARMIRADFPTRVYYVTLGGFDTHAAQAGRHAALLRQLGNGLQDFIATLEDDKLLDRVMVMTFSEFGRRVAENASGGTDHGAAAPLFIAGGAVRAGMHGRHPDLDNLDQGDLKYTVDFREVYATVLERWLELPAREVLGRHFRSLRLLDRV
jgi:uncharacterized protein (DUF1501 family)